MSVGIGARRTRVTKAAAIEPIGTAVESTSTAAVTSTATKTTSAASATPPCQRVGRASEGECSNQDEDPHRKSGGDVQIHFILHGRDSSTFRNSIRFASLGSWG